MTQFLIKWIIVSLFAFAIVNVAVRALGAMQPPNPALAGFTEDCEGKPQPCWYGIVPGVTGVKEVLDNLSFAGEPDFAKDIFSRDYTLNFVLPGSSPFCRLSLDFSQDIVVQGQISPCPTSRIYLGDIAALLENQQKFVSLPPDNIVYGGVSISVLDWPAPYSHVHLIRLLRGGVVIQHFPWLGFTSQNHYCQIVPTYPICF